MTTIAAGNHKQIYFDHLDDISITPGSGGYVNFDCSSPNSESRPVGRKIYSETLIAIPAGSTVFAEAVGADATYSIVETLGPVSSTSVLEAYYPASSNTGRRAIVGSAAPYAEYQSDGSYWVPVVMPRQMEMTAWYKAAMRVLSGQGQAFVAICGDSNVVGAGAGTGAKGLLAAVSGSPASQLASWLTAKGLPASDNSFFGEHLIQAYQSTNASAWDTRFALIGTATYYPNGAQSSFGGIMWQLNGAGEGVSYTPNITYDTVKIWYCNRTTGSFTVSNPGGGSSAGTVTTTAAAQTIGTSTISVTRGTGVCNIERASGDNWIIGAVFYDSQTPRVNILNGGCYGESMTSTNGPANNTNEWRAGAVMAAMGLDLAIIDETLNSYPNGTAGVSAFSTALSTVCSDVTGSGANLILATPQAVGTANQGTVSDAYIAAIRSKAAALGVPVADNYARLTPYATYSSSMGFADGTTLHMNAVGYRAKAVEFGRIMLEYAGL